MEKKTSHHVINFSLWFCQWYCPCNLRPSWLLHERYRSSYWQKKYNKCPNFACQNIVFHYCQKFLWNWYEKLRNWRKSLLRLLLKIFVRSKSVHNVSLTCIFRNAWTRLRTHSKMSISCQKILNHSSCYKINLSQRIGKT